jgi:hypothetical protein
MNWEVMKHIGRRYYKTQLRIFLVVLWLAENKESNSECHV